MAGDDGSIRFYDLMMRLIAWFEDIKAGPITSLSFSSSLPKKSNDPEAFMIPDFVISTKQGYIIGCQSSMFDSIDPIIRKGMVIMQGQNGNISAIATHPLKSFILIASENGYIQLWDYFTFRLQNTFKFQTNLRITKLLFDPSGEFVIAGTESGSIYILDAAIKQEYQEPLDFSTGSILNIQFSPDGETFAVSDLDNCVGLYKFMYHPLPYSYS